MPLITNPDGSHRFVTDQIATSSFDIESQAQARQRPSVGQPLRPPEWNIQPLPGYPGVSYFSLVLGGEGRGAFRQRGSFEALNDFGEQDLVYDDYEIGRLPFMINNDFRVPSTDDYGGRLCGAFYDGRSFISMADIPAGAALLWQDVGTGYESVMQPVAGYIPPAGAAAALCMKQISVNGAPSLWRGFGTATVSTLQMLTNVASAGVPVLNNIGETLGLCQTPIDGDSVQIYLNHSATGMFRLLMVNTNVGLGAATFRECVPMPRGGYTIGLVNLDGNPEVFYCGAANGVDLVIQALGPTAYAMPTFRGKMLRVDLRALTIYPVATALDFVLYATAGDNNDGAGAHDIFYCNGLDHQYMTRGADIPILPSADRPPMPPYFRRQCGGHWYKDGRFYWEENTYDIRAPAPEAVGTIGRRFEFDPALGRYGVRPVSRQMFTEPHTGIFSMGGPNMPWSPTTRNLISATRQEFLFQYQAERSETGYSKSHVDGAGPDTGPSYEASGYRRWPRLRPPGRPGAVMALARITGPPPANLRSGSGTEPGMDFHNARVEVSETHTQPMAVFYGDDGVDPDGTSRWRPAQDYPDNDSWCDELDITVRAYRDTGGANAARYTPNPGPIVIEGYLREIGAPPPSRNILNWAADRIAADDLSRPLL